MSLSRLQRENREFENMLPQILTVARFFWKKAPSKLRRRFEHDDFLAEVTAHCFMQFRRLCERGLSGRAFATPLATYACKHLAAGRTSTSAFLCDASAQDGFEFHPDLTELENREHVREVRHIEPGTVARDSQQNIREPSRAHWQDMLTACGRLNPSEGAALLVDVGEFFANLTPYKRRILRALADGNTPTLVAIMFGITAGRVVQIRKECLAIWDALNPPEVRRRRFENN